MPRKGKRRTIARGVYLDSGGYEVRITVGGHTYSERMPADSTINELKGKRADLEATGRTQTPNAERGSLASSVKPYLRLVQHLASKDDLEDHLRAWCVELGDVQRHRIKARDVIAIREQWKDAGLSPKTINNRVGTLRNLYHRLDGHKAPTPVDDVASLPVTKTIIERISDELLLAVDRRLQERERDGILPDAKTRARFRVFVSTGKRPIEIMRAKPRDVDFTARVWVPRDAKGGFCPGVYLNDDQLAAWKLFAEANAWGAYNQGAFARSLRAAGWPEKVRPYQARHSTWIAASERGIDLADIAVGAGHRDPRLTRQMYVPVLNSRLQRMAEALDGRFKGWPVVPKRGPSKSARKHKAK